MYVSWQIEQRVLGPLAFSISLSDELEAVDAVVTVSLCEGVGDDMMTCFKLHLKSKEEKNSLIFSYIYFLSCIYSLLIFILIVIESKYNHSFFHKE